MTVRLQHKEVNCGKAHVCIWCGESIGKGDKAMYFSGVFEGDFQSHYMHPECDSACQRSDIDEYGFTAYENKRGEAF